jgi:hypothetical protein
MAAIRKAQLASSRLTLKDKTLRANLDANAASLNAETNKLSENETSSQINDFTDQPKHTKKIKTEEKKLPLFSTFVAKLSSTDLYSDELDLTELHDSLHDVELNDVGAVLKRLCDVEASLQVIISERQIQCLRDFLSIKRGVNQLVVRINKDWVQRDDGVKNFLKIIDEQFQSTHGKLRTTEKYVDSLTSSETKTKVTTKRVTRERIRNSYDVVSTVPAQSPLLPETLYVYEYLGLPRLILRSVPKSHDQKREDKKMTDLSPLWTYVLAEATQEVQKSGKKKGSKKPVSSAIKPVTFDEWLLRYKDEIKILHKIYHGLDYINIEHDFNFYLPGDSSRLDNMDMDTVPESFNVLDYFSFYNDPTGETTESILSGELKATLQELLDNGEEMATPEYEKEIELADKGAYVVNMKKWFYRRFVEEVATTGMTPLTDELLSVLFINWDSIVVLEPELEVVRSDLLQYYGTYGRAATFEYNMSREGMTIETVGHLLAHKVLESTLRLVQTVFESKISDLKFKRICINLGRLIIRGPILHTSITRNATTTMKQLMHTLGKKFHCIQFKKFQYDDFNAKLHIERTYESDRPPVLLARHLHEDLDEKRINSLKKANSLSGNLLTSAELDEFNYTDGLDLVMDTQRHFSILTRFEAISGYSGTDLLSSFIDSNEGIKYEKVDNLEYLLAQSVEQQITELNRQKTKRPSVLKTMLSSAKATSSATQNPTIIRIEKRTPELDGTNLSKVVSTIEVKTTQKKPNLINAASILSEPVRTNVDMIIPGGSRMVQGGKGKRAVYPTKQAYHIAGAIAFYEVDKAANSSRKGTTLFKKYGQGIVNAVPHLGVPEIIAASSDRKAIIFGLDVSSFDIAQKFTNHIIEGAMRKGLIGDDRLTGGRTLNDMTPADMANELLTNTPPRHKYQTPLGYVLVRQGGNKSGVFWTGIQNNIVNVSNHEMATQECSKRLIQARRDGILDANVIETRYHIRVFGDDSTFIAEYDKELTREQIIFICETFVASYIDTAGKLGFEINARKGMIGVGGAEYLKNTAIYGNIKSVNQVKFRATEKSAVYHSSASEKLTMFRDISDLSITRGMDENRTWKYLFMMMPIDLTIRAGCFRLHFLAPCMAAIGRMYLGGTLNNRMIVSSYGQHIGWQFDIDVIRISNSLGAVSDSAYDSITKRVTTLDNFKESQALLESQTTVVGTLPREYAEYSKENMLRRILASAVVGPLARIETSVNAYNIVIALLRGTVGKSLPIHRLNFGFSKTILQPLTRFDRSPYTVQSLQYRRMLTEWGLNNDRISTFDPKSKLQRAIAQCDQHMPVDFDIETVYRMYQRKGSYGVFVILTYYGVPPTLINQIIVAAATLDAQVGEDKYAVDLGVYSSQASQIGVTDTVLESILSSTFKQPLIDRALTYVMLHQQTLLFALLGKRLLRVDLNARIQGIAALEADTLKLSVLSKLLLSIE